MTLSAEFSVNGDSDVQEHLVAYGATVSLVALSTAFHTIDWQIVSSSKTGSVAPTIVRAGTPDGATASFVQVANPGDGLGRAWVVRCVQADQLGNTSVAYRVIGTLNVSNKLPICADEYNYRDSTHGWSQVINQLLATAGGGASGDVVGPGSAVDDRIVTFDGTTGKLVQDGGVKVSDLVHKDGSIAFTADQSLGGNKLTGLDTPTDPDDAATKDYVDAAIAGVGGSGAGGGRGFPFTYSATTTDADPGAGTFRGNNATLASVTALYVDLLEFGGTTITAWLDSLDDQVGAIKGIIRLQSLSDPTKWIEYDLTGWTTASGYRKLTVAYLAGPGGLTTTAGDTFLSFDGSPSGPVADESTLTLSGATLAAKTNGIGNSHIRQSGARSLVGRSANSAGNVADIAGSTAGFAMVDDGSTLAFRAPNFVAQDVTTTGNLLMGATPRSSTGTGLRTGHGWQWKGRNNANNADVNVVGWGVSAVDTAALGDTSAIMLETKELAAGRKVVALCFAAAVTTTNGPANIGDQVALWGYAGTEPTTGVPVGCFAMWTTAAGFYVKGPNAGHWAVAPNTEWQRSYQEDDGTTSSTSATTVATLDLSGFADGSGTCVFQVYSQDGSNAQGCKAYAFTYIVQAGVLISGTTTPDELYGSNAVVSAVTLAYPGSDQIQVKVAAADATAYSHYVHAKFEGHNKV